MKINFRIGAALLATLAVATVMPLSALADMAIAQPAECGNFTVAIVEAPKTFDIFDSRKAVRATIQPVGTANLTRKAGYEVDFKGVAIRTGDKWRNFSLWFLVPEGEIAGKPNKVSVDNLWVGFRLGNGQTLSKSFRELGVSSLRPGTWQRLVTAPSRLAGFGTDQILKRAVVYLQADNTQSHRVTFGAIDVIHNDDNLTGPARAGIPADGFLRLNVGGCRDLDVTQ